MLLLKKFNSIALICAVTASGALANTAPQAAPAAPVPAAQPQAPTQPQPPVDKFAHLDKSKKPVRKGIRSVPLSEIQRYVRGFYIKTEGSCDQQKLKVYGQVHPKCLKHLRIELDDPNTDQSGSWMVRLEVSNLVHPDDGNFEMENIEKNCSLEATSRCLPPEAGAPAGENDCVEISEVEGYKGRAGFERILNIDGDVKYRFNTGLAAKPYEPLEFADADSDLAKIESCKVQDKRLREEAKNRSIEDLVEECNDALKEGDLEAYGDMRARLASVLGKKEMKNYSGVLKSLDSEALDAAKAKLEKVLRGIKNIDEDDNSVETAISKIDAYLRAYEEFLKKYGDDDDIEVKVAKLELELKSKAITAGIELESTNISGFNKLIDISNRFAREAAHKDGKKKGVELLLVLAKTANDRAGLTDQEFHATLVLVERALRTASALDPSRKDLKNGMFTAKLKRFEAAARSGDDELYKAATRKEAQRATQEALAYAMRTKDSNALNIARRMYQATHQPQFIRTKTPVTNPWTGEPVTNPWTGETVYGETYGVGSRLDADFHKAREQRMTLEQQFNQFGSDFQASMRGLGGGSSFE